jgi:hypothetical protein
MTMTRKAFTVAEANTLIPSLEAVLERIVVTVTRAREHRDQLEVLDVLWGERVQEPENPDHAEWQRQHAGLRDAASELEWHVQREITERGIRFPQGGLQFGLLDFPTTWEGRWVYLCWRRGEPQVVAWHEIGGGFTGRKPITPEHARRMGREDDPAMLDDSELDF